jgi:hypothetical protein
MAQRAARYIEGWQNKNTRHIVCKNIVKDKIFEFLPDQPSDDGLILFVANYFLLRCIQGIETTNTLYSNRLFMSIIQHPLVQRMPEYNLVFPMSEFEKKLKTYMKMYYDAPNDHERFKVKLEIAADQEFDNQRQLPENQKLPLYLEFKQELIGATTRKTQTKGYRGKGLTLPSVPLLTPQELESS